MCRQLVLITCCLFVFRILAVFVQQQKIPLYRAIFPVRNLLFFRAISQMYLYIFFLCGGVKEELETRGKRDRTTQNKTGMAEGNISTVYNRGSAGRGLVALSDSGGRCRAGAV